MANTVFKLRRSSVAGKVPNTSTLAIGELGLNLTDRKLYSSDGTNVWETGANLTTLTVSTNTNVNNVIFPITGGIYANGTFGLDTQVLKSNGSAIYWGTGGGGSGVQLVNQQYVGDGVTNTFSVTGGYDSNTLYVYVNGVLLRKGVEVDVISGTNFTIYNPPPNGAYIDVFGTGLTIANGFSTTVSQQFTANGNSNTFVVPSGFIPTTLQVYLNGVKQIPSVDYTTSGGNTVNFFSTPPNNYIVDVFAYNTTVMQSAPVRQSNTADGTSVSYVISGGYIPGQLDTYVNGVKVLPSVANVSTGYNVTFSSPPPAGAELSFVGFVPTNYVGVNTSASYVWSNTQTFANLYMVTTAGINANGSYGGAGQVLTSNGTSVYWSNSATFVRQTFTGTGACTTFQVTGGYNAYNLDVYVTGVKQLAGTDVTISSGNNIVFSIPPANNASIEVVGVVPLTYSFANTSAAYTWTNTQTFSSIVFTNTANFSANGSFGSNGQVLTSNGTCVYWSDGYSQVRQTFTASGSATFTVTGGYTPNQLDVYLNGVKQSAADIVISSGSTVGFNITPPVGSTIDVVGLKPSVINLTYVNTDVQYTWSNTHAYGALANGTTVNSSLISVGNSTVNTTVNSTSVYVSGNPVSPYAMRNRIINGDMRIWQRGTSFTNPAYSGNAAYTSDRWFVSRNYSTANCTVTQQTTGVNGIAKYGLRFQRSVNDANTANPYIIQHIENKNMQDLAGQTVTLSGWLKVGANFSNSNLYCSLISGTGTDENYYAGYTGTSTVCQISVPSSTTSYTKFAATGTVPTNSNELCVYITYTPSGTAGANDWLEFTDIQVEQGSVATPFERRPYGMELQLCQRYYFQYCQGNTDFQELVTRTGTTSGDMNISVPVQMRIVPSLVLGSSPYGRLVCYDSSFSVTTVNVTSLGVGSSSSNSFIHIGIGNIATAGTNSLGGVSFDTWGFPSGIGLTAEL